MPLQERDRKEVRRLVVDYQREQVEIPKGNVAIVIGLNPSNMKFEIKIGSVSKYKDENAVESGMARGEVNWNLGFPVINKEGNEEWMGIKQSKRRRIIELQPAESREKVNLSLVEGVFWGDRNVEKTAEIDASNFAYYGLVLDEANEGNTEGTILSSPISQLLYEFQEGIGRFKGGQFNPLWPRFGV
jgi:outer membrane protein assembly factor BamE (lipoprotein component of BamABCDE complex)